MQPTCFVTQYLWKFAVTGSEAKIFTTSEGAVANSLLLLKPICKYKKAVSLASFSLYCYLRVAATNQAQSPKGRLCPRRRIRSWGRPCQPSGK
jgi:hypothetical protein